MANLSSGSHLPITLTFLIIALNYYLLTISYLGGCPSWTMVFLTPPINSLNSYPVIHTLSWFSSPFLIIDAWWAQWIAVCKLSPESIITLTPPALSSSMLFLTPSFKSSYNANNDTNVNSFSRFALSFSVWKLLKFFFISSHVKYSISLEAYAIHLYPYLAKS